MAWCWLVVVVGRGLCGRANVPKRYAGMAICRFDEAVFLTS